MDYSIEAQYLFGKTFGLSPELLPVFLSRLKQVATEVNVSTWSKMLFTNSIDQIEAVFEEILLYYHNIDVQKYDTD